MRRDASSETLPLIFFSFAFLFFLFFKHFPVPVGESFAPSFQTYIRAFQRWKSPLDASACRQSKRTFEVGLLRVILAEWLLVFFSVSRVFYTEEIKRRPGKEISLSCKVSSLMDESFLMEIGEIRIKRNFMDWVILKGFLLHRETVIQEVVEFIN